MAKNPGQLAALIAGPPLGVLAGFLAGRGADLGDWSTAPVDELTSATPRSSKRIARKAAVAQAIAGAIGVGLAALLAVTVVLGWPRDIIDNAATGLAVGVGIGIVSAMAFGFDSEWGRYHLALAWLASRRKLPRQLMTFLEDAHRRGVLRQAGSTYEFRHAICKTISQANRKINPKSISDTFHIANRRITYANSTIASVASCETASTGTTREGQAATTRAKPVRPLLTMRLQPPQEPKAPF